MTFSKNLIGLVLGPLLAVVVFFTLQSFGWQAPACWTGAITAICATWWIFEPIPIPATG